MLRSFGVGLTRLGGLTAVGGVAYVTCDDGRRRQATFWSRVGPVAWDYYWQYSQSSPRVKIQKYLKNEQEERSVILQQLHEKHAPEILQVMLDLKGLYIKLGQVLSVTALPVPETYRNLFRTLQSDVPGWETFDDVVQPVLERELGKPLDQVFESFEKVPCGAASIGQAHKATLKDGDQVIVKVQYPQAAWQVPADIKCVGDFLELCVWAGVVDRDSSKLSFDEFSRQFLAELDYRAETRNLQQIYDSSVRQDSPYIKRGVLVPEVYSHLSTDRVITMTYLPGPKLEEEARRQLEMLGIDTSRGVASLISKSAARDEATRQIQAQDVKKPETSSPISSLSKWIGSTVGFDSMFWLVRLYKRVRLWSTAAIVQTIQSIPIKPLSWQEWASHHHTAAKQADRLRLTESWIDALFDVHGHQVFDLGLFNADPHPGNILVVEQQEEDKLGLIDFGQCKQLDPDEKVRVARLVLSVANQEQPEEIAQAFRDLGIKTKNNSTLFLASFAQLMFGRLSVQHLDHEWHQKLHEMDRVVYFPKELSMVYRTSLLLRGLAMSLQLNTSVGEQWRDHALAAIERSGLPS